ncbi:MAG: DUF2177 domain-containing protein [Marinilabiliales bacterium]|nr:MAG: DUF2177 domain-containing protein [Marinilabiliales bacterium]
MNIKGILLSYILTLIVFLIVDLVWLGFIARGLYKKYLGSFLSENVNWTAAIIFYLIYVVGIFIFVIHPAINRDSVIHAITMGSIFGMLAYATYDLTNLATLKDWPITIVIIDIVWGSILTLIVSLAGFYIVKWVH